jgi:hypothetical protein
VSWRDDTTASHLGFKLVRPRHSNTRHTCHARSSLPRYSHDPGGRARHRPVAADQHARRGVRWGWCGRRQHLGRPQPPPCSSHTMNDSLPAVCLHHTVTCAWRLVCFSPALSPHLHVQQPAVPFAGLFRLIDVPVSNCLHSGISNIYVLTQYNATSLDRHLSRAYQWVNGITFTGQSVSQSRRGGGGGRAGQGRAEDPVCSGSTPVGQGGGGGGVLLCWLVCSQPR